MKCLNVLGQAISWLILIVLILFLGGLLAYPKLTINQDKSEQINAMTLQVKGTAFEKAFDGKIKYALKDGKIQNSEFQALKDSFNGFLVVKGTDALSEYSKKTSSMLIQQEEDDQRRENTKALLGVFMLMVFAVLVTIVGYKTIKP